MKNRKNHQCHATLPQLSCAMLGLGRWGKKGSYGRVVNRDLLSRRHVKAAKKARIFNVEAWYGRASGSFKFETDRRSVAIIDQNLPVATSIATRCDFSGEIWMCPRATILDRWPRCYAQRRRSNRKVICGEIDKTSESYSTQVDVCAWQRFKAAVVITYLILQSFKRFLVQWGSK